MVTPSGINVVAALGVAVVLLGTCGFGANAALRVQNNLENAAQLSVLFPPVCEPCPRGPVHGPFHGPFHGPVHGPVHVACPEVCIRGVFDIESGAQEVALERVTTYPPAYLKIQLQDKEYCVPDNALIRLTPKALLRIIGVGHYCPNSISAVIVDNSSHNVCLPLCSI